MSIVVVLIEKGHGKHIRLTSYKRFRRSHHDRRVPMIVVVVVFQNTIELVDVLVVRAAYLREVAAVRERAILRTSTATNAITHDEVVVALLAQNRFLRRR